MLPVIGVSAASMTTSDGRFRYYINASYVHSVVADGGAPLLIQPGLGPEALAAIWERLDGLMLTGGHDLEPALFGEASLPELGQVDPPRDATELWLEQCALDADLPTLVVCRGMQLFNVATGGTLWQDLPSQWPDVLTHNHPESSRDYIAHTVSLAHDSRLAAILGVEVSVNSYHHQTVEAIGDGFRLVGTALDGVPEAMEHTGSRFMLAVQFHPEDLPDSDACRRLFAAFVEAASQARA